MDPFSDVLHLLAAKSYLTSGLMTGPHWSMHFSGFDGMKFIAVRQGTFWFRTDDETQWRELGVGEGIILTRSTGFLMATDITLAPVESVDAPRKDRDGVVDFGGDSHVLIAGKMEVDNSFADILLGELPQSIYLLAGSDEASSLTWLMKQLYIEKVSDKPGSSIASSHLMHLVMIEGLRSWIATHQSANKGWLNALRDRRIIKALSAMHSEPAKSWKLQELAEIAGMSRAGFARKFVESTGMPPLNYLTQWRMRLASKSLRLSNQSIKSLAYGLGYSAESTFSTVFKRVYGVSPREHRSNATRVDHESTP